MKRRRPSEGTSRPPWRESRGETKRPLVVAVVVVVVVVVVGWR